MSEPPSNDSLNSSSNPQLITVKMELTTAESLPLSSNQTNTTNNNSIFMLPSVTKESNPMVNNPTSTVTLLNTLMNETNKVPTNLNSITSVTNSKSFLSSHPASKKIIINTANLLNKPVSSTQTNSSSSSNLVAKPTGSVLSNSKIFTISAPNSNLAANSNLISQANASVSGINTNKIQYVKIVNPTNPTSAQTNTQPHVVQNSSPSKPIKITTISANTNTIAITTTTTNSENTPYSIKEENQLKAMQAMATSSTQETNALLNAVANNGQRPTSTQGASTNINSSVKLTTFQIVNTNNKPTAVNSQSIATTSNAPVIQRIQSVNLVNNQPIAKTIVSSNSSPTTLLNHHQNPTSNYKVLSQQLPPSQPNSQVNVKPISSLNINKTMNSNTSHSPSQYTITKTVAAQSSSETGKQIITTIRNDSSPAATTIIKKQPQITTISNMNGLTTVPLHQQANNANSQFSILPLKSNSAPLTVLTTSVTSPEGTDIFINSPIKSHSPSQVLGRLNNNPTTLNISPPASATANGSTGNNVRKPCNCTKSMCLKLYCDCFAMGSFCHDCNCVNCFNTLEHEDERNKAIKMVLDRNPQAFQSKIGKYTPQVSATTKTTIPVPAKPEEVLNTKASEDIDEIQSRHIKGCNCKKSNCLKRYCECYLAKIQCSALCKCVGCKNCDESTKTLLQLANAVDMRKQQQAKLSTQIQQSHLAQSQSKQQHGASYSINGLYASNGNSFWQRPKTNEGSCNLISNHLNADMERNGYDQMKTERQESLRDEYLLAMSGDSAGRVCQRLVSSVATELERLKSRGGKGDLAEQSENIEIYEEEDEDEHYNEHMEGLIIEEFGRCLANIIDVVEKKN